MSNFEVTVSYPYLHMTPSVVEKLMEMELIEFRYSCIWGPFALAKRAGELKSVIATLHESERNFMLIVSTLRAAKVEVSTELSITHRSLLESLSVFNIDDFFNKINFHPSVLRLNELGIDFREIYKSFYHQLRKDNSCAVIDANLVDIFCGLIFSCNGNIDVLRNCAFLEDLIDDVIDSVYAGKGSPPDKIWVDLGKIKNIATKE